MPKKCPVCNSTRYKKLKENYYCARCGYKNLSEENMKNKIKENQI